MEKIKAVRLCVKYFLVFSVTPIFVALILMLITLILRAFGVSVDVGSYLTELVSCCTIIGVCCFFEKNKKKNIKLRKIRLYSGVIYVLSGLAVFMVFTILLNLLPFFQGSGDDGGDGLYSSSWGQFLSLIVSKIVAAPVTEEVVFRGLMYSELKRTFSKNIAMLSVSFLFAALHFSSAFMVITAFILGLWFSFLTDKYNSIIPGILAHSAYNFAFVFVSINTDFMNSYGIVVFTVLVFLSIVSAVGMFLDIREINKLENK